MGDELIFEDPSTIQAKNARYRKGGQSDYRGALLALIEHPGEWVRITPEPIGARKAADLGYNIRSGRMVFLRGLIYEAKTTRVDPEIHHDDPTVPNYYVYARYIISREKEKE